MAKLDREIKRRDIYRGRRRRVKLPVLILLGLLALALIIVVTLFQSMQKYLVYTRDGLRLELPMLTTPGIDKGASALAPPRRDFDLPDSIVIETPNFEEADTGRGLALGDMHAIFVRAENISDTGLSDAAARATRLNADALVLEMKPDSGRLSWRSAERLPNDYDTTGSYDIRAALKTLSEDGIYLAAQISVFVDELMSQRGSMALRDTIGDPYRDADRRCWLDPYNRNVRVYILSLIEELEALGFDEVLLTNLAYPRPETRDGAQQLPLTHGASTLEILPTVSNTALTLARYSGDIRVSVRVNEALITGGANGETGQDPALFFRIFDRVAVETTALTLGDTRLIAGNSGYTSGIGRFVPIIENPLESGSWIS